MKPVLSFIIVFFSLLNSPQTISAQDQGPSKDYDLHISKGIIEFDARRYDNARLEFKKALEQRSDDPDANYYLGLVYLDLNELAEAEKRFKKTIETEPSYQGAHFQLGIIYYKREVYNDALSWFIGAEKTEPDRGMTYYYQGLINHKQGNYEKTPPLFLKAMGLTKEVSLTSHYYSAISYYKRGILEEAEEEFNETIRLEPESDIARSSKEYIEEIERAKKGPKRWDLSLSLSLQYDTNVVLEPADSALSAQIARNQDLRSVAFLRGGYRFIRGGPWNLGANYSFYSSLQKDLSDFNTISHDILFYSYYSGQGYQARIQYDFNPIAVDNNRYLSSHTINPMLNITYGARYITQVSYRYQLKDFKDSQKFPTNSERDGVNNLIGLTQIILFPDKNGNLRIGYAFDSDSTDGPDWDYNGHKIIAGLGFPMIKKIVLDLLVEYNKKMYDNPNNLSPSGDRRDDTYKTYTIGISREFRDYLTAALQYLYSKNDSNITVFEYNRNIYSLTITGRW